MTTEGVVLPEEFKEVPETDVSMNSRDVLDWAVNDIISWIADPDICSSCCQSGRGVKQGTSHEKCTGFCASGQDAFSTRGSIVRAEESSEPTPRFPGAATAPSVSNIVISRDEGPTVESRKYSPGHNEISPESNSEGAVAADHPPGPEKPS